MVQPPLQDGVPSVPQVTIEKLARRQRIYLVTSVEGLFTLEPPRRGIALSVIPGSLSLFRMARFAGLRTDSLTPIRSIAVGSDLLPPCSFAARASCRLGGQSSNVWRNATARSTDPNSASIRSPFVNLTRTSRRWKPFGSAVVALSSNAESPCDATTSLGAPGATRTPNLLIRSPEKAVPADPDPSRLGRLRGVSSYPSC